MFDFYPGLPDMYHRLEVKSVFVGVMNIKHTKIKIHIYAVALFPGSPRASDGKLGIAWERGYIVEPSSNNVVLGRQFQV